MRESVPHTDDDPVRQLDEFAYIISHDFNAPVRHIREFLKLLLASENFKAGEREQEYVLFIERSLKKIEDMQTALLVYSRLTTRADPHARIDTNELVKEIVDSLRAPAGAIKTEILPPVRAEKGQITLLFKHLLENALKFQAPGAIPEILIGARKNQNRVAFTIKDNGIGIAPQYHQEIFKMFRKLHPDKAYPGIGAGLFIVQKIIALHDGEIRVDSDVGKGSNFYFTLMAA